jgi:alpha-tubulin suppressor-like RCC1 family protein
MRWRSVQGQANRRLAGRPLLAGAFALLAMLIVPSVAAARASGHTSAVAAARSATAAARSAPARPATAAARSAVARSATAAASVLETWGRNDLNQLGDGTSNNRSLPVKIKLPPGVTVTSASTGCIHTLALTSTGQILAWGINRGDELGDNGIAFPGSSTPVTVQTPPGSKITAIAAGCSFSLALTSTGDVLAWGQDNSFEFPVPTPVKLPDGVTIKGISAGWSHALAVTTTGQVYAWGSDSNGELGDGGGAAQATPQLVNLPPGTNVTAVSAGENYSLALTSQGQVLAWGLNAQGELGNGTTTGSGTPVMVQLSAGTKVKALSASCTHTLALTSGGKVLAWGDNTSGQLGDGTVQSSDVPVTATLPAGTKVSAVSAECSQSVALTSAGTVLTWGNGEFGALGNGFTLNEPFPVTVPLPSGLTATAISSGPTAQDSVAITH